jgi:hypothetical protein
MPDRVLRDELLDSERWIGLPGDTDRLVFICLLFKCDDFGNLEGGLRRLFRFMHDVSQVKTEEASATVLLHLVDADLIRRYEVDGRELFHIPRFSPHRQYLVRKYPQSPWDEERELGKNQRVVNRGLAKYQELTKNMSTTSQQRSNDVAQGVGVGVGERLTRAPATPVDNSDAKATHPKGQPRANERKKSKSKAPTLQARPGESMDEYRIRLLQHRETA